MFRTPKLEALHRLIDWLNSKREKSFKTLHPYKPANLELAKYGLDLRPIFENAWLSGFVDADGNFNVIISPRKKPSCIRVQTQFRLEIRQEYSRKKLSCSYGTTYIDNISIIASALQTKVYSRARLLKESLNYAYYIVAGSTSSKHQLRKYFQNFPLMSSKYKDYETWCKIMDLSQNPPHSAERIAECRLLKDEMNNNRKSLNWDHHIKNYLETI